VQWDKWNEKRQEYPPVRTNVSQRKREGKGGRNSTDEEKEQQHNNSAS
jgi:hypothetical protein